MKKFTKESAMRYALLIGMWLVAIVFIAIAYRLATKDTIDYFGMTALIFSLSAFVGTLVTGKFKQKQIETK